MKFVSPRAHSLTVLSAPLILYYHSEAARTSFARGWLFTLQTQLVQPRIFPIERQIHGDRKFQLYPHAAGLLSDISKSH